MSTWRGAWILDHDLSPTPLPRGCATAPGSPRPRGRNSPSGRAWKRSAPGPRAEPQDRARTGFGIPHQDTLSPAVRADFHAVQPVLEPPRERPVAPGPGPVIEPVQPPQLRECLNAYGQEPFCRTEEARLDAAGHYR